LGKRTRNRGGRGEGDLKERGKYGERKNQWGEGEKGSLKDSIKETIGTYFWGFGGADKKK